MGSAIPVFTGMAPLRLTLGFERIGLFADLWIPAFTGMTGESKGEGFVARDSGLIARLCQNQDFQDFDSPILRLSPQPEIPPVGIQTSVCL